MKGKTERIKKHLAKHPSDYVSVVALYKSISDDIEHEREVERWEKRKLIAECKRRRSNEQRTC